MAIQRQLRRGTKAENDSFTGAIGELVQDTDNDRIVIHNGSTSGGLGVPNFNDLLKDSLVSGTAAGTNTYTLTLPYFTSSPQDGQKVKVTFTNANNSTSTLNINGTGAVTLAAADGTDFVGGEIEAGGTYVFVYGSSEWRIDDSVGGGGVSYLETQVFTSSGTWTKPSGCAYVDVIVIGGGGSSAGSSTSGGTGGTSSFGSHCTATGGQGSAVNSDNQPSGGTASGGDINIDGQKGGIRISSTKGGQGGDSLLGFGGAITDDNVPTAASGYGAGGAGRGNSITSSGGASAGTAIKTILDGDLSSTETVTVGARGTVQSNGGAGSGGIVIVKAYG